MESSDSSQSKINTFFVKSNMTTKDNDLQYDLTLLGTESSGSKDSAVTVSFDEDLSEKNVKEPMSEDQTEPMTTFIDVDELNSLSQLRENSEQNTVTESEIVTPSLGRNADRVSFLINFNLLLLILAFYRVP
jgi:hypothetical protein